MTERKHTIQISQKKFREWMCYYFIIVMFMFRPLSFIIASFETSYPIISKLLYVFFLVNYVSIVWVVLSILGQKRIHIDNIAVVLLMVGGIFVTKFFFPQNDSYLNPVILNIIYCVLSYLLIRTSTIDMNKLKQYLIVVSRWIFFFIVVVSVLVFRFDYSGMYMTFSDACSIPCAFFLYSGIVERKHSDVFWGILLLFLILAFGGRGAFLSMCLLIALFYLFEKNSTKKIIIVLFGLMCGIVFALVWKQIANMLLDLFTSVGLSSRTLRAIVNGTLTNDSSRFLIWTYLFEFLQNNNAITGIGLCGDRYLLPQAFALAQDSVYAHNLFIELFLNFGVIIGGILIVYILKKVMFGFIFNSEMAYETKAFLAILFVLSFVQLMTSRSYLSEPVLFIYMAMLANSTHRRGIYVTRI